MKQDIVVTDETAAASSTHMALPRVRKGASGTNLVVRIVLTTIQSPVPSPMSSARTHPEHALPQEARDFIERHLRSAGELELLLLLSRSPDTFWSPTAAATVVGAAEQDLRAHFGRFAAVGLLERGRQTDSFRFAPSSDEDRAAIAVLARIYAERRNDVLRAIAGSISQIAAFSDAFRFPRR